MERSRPAVRPPEAAEESPEPVLGFGELPSPRELLERARAPDAGRPEVDALLRGLKLPLAPGEDARARADLLHDILEDKGVCAFVGSEGRRVSHAAVAALVELGYPYALEVPPELFAEARSEALGKRAEGSKQGGPGRGLSFLAGLVELLPLVFIAYVVDDRELNTLLLFCGLLVVLTSFVPGLLAKLEAVLRMRWLHVLMCLLVALPGLLWLAGTVFMLGLGMSNHGELGLFALFPLGLSLLRLVGAWGLYEPSPSEDE